MPHFQAAAMELLPEVFAKLEAGDPGVPQAGGEYQQPFEDEYAVVDLTQPAADVHRQVRAWSFMPRHRVGSGARARRRAPQASPHRASLRLTGAERLDCADGPLWILEAEPA